MDLVYSSGNIIGKLRHNRTNDDFLNIININFIILIKRKELNKEFIACTVWFCIDYPGNFTTIPLNKTETDIGISDIDDY